MLYEILIRPFVRRMNPKNASRVALAYYKTVGKIPGARLLSRVINNNKSTGLEKEVFGLQFYNPLGLASGLDLHANLYNDLNDLGFSFSQAGPLDVNGVRKAVRNIQKDPKNDILAACIGSDYLSAFTLAYDFFDFFVIEFQESFDEDVLISILDARLTYEQYKPIVLKPGSNAPFEAILRASEFCMMNGIDAIEIKTGDNISKLSAHTKGRLPIIANGRITSPRVALDALRHGASLVEMGSDFAYKGPHFVGKVLKYMEQNRENNESGRKDSLTS